jgi:formylglycine-generating enzyme required for sulfatase activity
MILAEGDYCPEVEQECLRWLPGAHGKIGNLRCAEFKQPSVCKSKKREHKRFCIDKFEYPNKEGELPPVDITWYAAGAKCKEMGKRLCAAKEWTFACEGEDMRPYPYGDGFHRDEQVCDQEHESMPNPDLPRSEWSKYYYAHPSGSMKECKSQFGVYDMTANVDEWVINEGGRTDGDPYVSGLKGGYWTYRVRTRCRPMTTAHGPSYSFYQQGFRCCKDAD